ncbi:hypothetical protein TruAng_007743 [Truncatella angustata]|nr:hypothetical protein TruAng_007743 [Truncatella angustata]
MLDPTTRHCPCSNCIQSGSEAECTFPKRDRQLRVSQNYLEDLLAENEKLRRLEGSNLPRKDDNVENERSRTGSGRQEQTDGPIQNPLFGDRPWFHDTPDIPILIGEAADAAFATRFCQTLSDGSFKHIQRVSFPADSTMAILGASSCQPPTRGRARFLMKAAIRVVSQHYHIVLKSVVFATLERFLHQPAVLDVLLTSKIWALLALGEMYTARSGSRDNFPGLAYFAQANKAQQVVNERPSHDSIESLYNLLCNRRHSAWCLAGSAVRQGLIMGLHLNVPESQLSDRILIEHRRRVWWTAYEFDRLLAARLSQPFSIQDDEIQVDLPSSVDMPIDSKEDFTEASDLVNRIKLVKLTGQITTLLYGRKLQNDSFLQRVQQALKDLQDWFHKLEGLFDTEGQRFTKATSGPTRALLLSFNQCMIVATRPVALYVLRAHRGTKTSTTGQSTPVIPDNAQALTDACVRCARHSHSLLMDSWVDGSFFTFDYFDTLNLFSVATILAVSSLLNAPGSSKDRDDFELSLQLLTDLKGNGNCAAVEFSRHLESMKACMNRIEDSEHISDVNDVDGLDITVPNFNGIGLPYASSSTTYNMTAGMALAEPSMQAFLAQTDPNFQQMDLSLLHHELDGFYWPEG